MYRRRPRDSKKTAAYRAENSVFGGLWLPGTKPYNKVLTKAATKKYVASILASEFWKTRKLPPREDGKDPGSFREFAHIDVRFHEGMKGAWAWKGRIKFGPKARRKWVVLHELAHAIDYSREAGHGRHWAMIYLLLVRRFIGKAEHDALKRAFKARRVACEKKRAPRPKREVSEATLAALARGRAKAARNRIEKKINKVASRMDHHRDIGNAGMVAWLKRDYDRLFKKLAELDAPPADPAPEGTLWAAKKGVK